MTSILVRMSMMFTLLVLSSVTAPLLNAQILPREHHPWGRFEPGSWKRVRIVTEMYDDRGEIAGVTTQETTTTLVEVKDAELSLRVEAVREVGGKRFVGAPQLIRQPILSTEDEVSPQGTETLKLSGRDVPVEVYTNNSPEAGGRRVDTLYYSDSLSPYVLKRISISQDDAGHALSQTESETVAVGMPYKILSETKTACYVRTIQRVGDLSKYTMEVQCESIPGGVVSHTSREEDQHGKVVRRSTLELLDYCVHRGEGETAPLPRRRPLFPRLRRRP
ncbi:MAG: hypothetical protein KDA60_20450 [Planctomycetales bacterium]|nr:hypothetical protein [Planctomycetales bacterium]